MSKVDDLHQSIVAALRNPENTDNLLLTPTQLLGYDTSVICWVDDDGNEPNVQPLAIIVTPEIFELIKLK